MFYSSWRRWLGAYKNGRSKKPFRNSLRLFVEALEDRQLLSTYFVTTAVDNGDNVNPEMVRALVLAGAAIDAAMPSGAQPIEHAACRILPATVAAMVELGADPRRGLDALLSWWPTAVQFAGYRAGEIAAVVDILRAGGAEVIDRHRELAARAGASQVEAALRR